MALLTSILRTLLVFASFSVSLLVVAISGTWILALSFGSYSAGLLALFPWFFGICGVAGLFRSRSDRATRSAWELRTDVVLLLLGVIGALIFAVLYMDRFGASSGVVPLAVLAIFPLLPVGVAAAEILRSDEGIIGGASGNESLSGTVRECGSGFRRQRVKVPSIRTSAEGFFE